MITSLVLASASPARLHSLRRAGVAVSAVVSGVDESGVRAATTAELTVALAKLKAEAVLADIEGETAVLGCDSLLDLDGQPIGKPGSAEAAAQVWRTIRGRRGTLITGHHLVIRRAGQVTRASRPVATEVTFADLSDAEIDAYVATGEPLDVAGGFTIDGYGASYVTALCGDHHNVIGVSLPALRELFAEAGIPWHQLWARC